MESIVCNKQINIIYKNESIANLEMRFDKGCSILYVVNENGQYLGCVTRKEMLIGMKQNCLVVNYDSYKIKHGEDEFEKAKEIFHKHHGIQNIPVINENELILYEYTRQVISDDFDSAKYWEERYKNGGNSGEGSYSRLAEFKAEVINDFIQEHNVNSMIEWGFGDGNQLSLLKVAMYIGYDVSETALHICREKFSDDKSKEFRYYDGSIEPNVGTYDMAISLDVLYHLVEDRKFSDYMYNLFHSSNKYVCIYSSDYEAKQRVEHVRRRKFTEYVKDEFREWNLMSVIRNPYLYDGSRDEGMSNSNFYFYVKVM